jgi:hypothetical protein
MSTIVGAETPRIGSGSDAFIFGLGQMADEKAGSASGNRTRISALKGPRANRCTIAPERIAEQLFIAPPLIGLLLGMREEFTRGVQTGSSGVRNGAATLRFPAHTLA